MEGNTILCYPQLAFQNGKIRTKRREIYTIKSFNFTVVISFNLIRKTEIIPIFHLYFCQTNLYFY